jgi:hypothetical protein
MPERQEGKRDGSLTVAIVEATGVTGCEMWLVCEGWLLSDGYEVEAGDGSLRSEAS